MVFDQKWTYFYNIAGSLRDTFNILNSKGPKHKGNPHVFGNLLYLWCLLLVYLLTTDHNTLQNNTIVATIAVCIDSKIYCHTTDTNPLTLTIATMVSYKTGNPLEASLLRHRSTPNHESETQKRVQTSKIDPKEGPNL